MSQVPCFRFLVRSIHHSFWAIQEMWRKWRYYIWSEIHNADFTLLQSVALPLMLTKVFIWLWKYFQIMMNLHIMIWSFPSCYPKCPCTACELEQTKKYSSIQRRKTTIFFFTKIATRVMCWQISLPGGILSLGSGQALITLLGGKTLEYYKNLSICIRIGHSDFLADEY